MERTRDDVRVEKYLRGEEFDTSSITFIDRSVQSHYLAFCAEASRLQDGKTLDFAEFKASICK